VVYRAACELINNGMKHSGASRIEIDLRRHQKIITLQYLDNGRGFDMEKLSSEESAGMGIPNIETRVRSVDGVFVIESAKGKGTSAIIRVDR
jgi:signal transduction histidine kinase